MKPLPTLLLACTLATLSLAQTPAAKPEPAPAPAKESAAVATLDVAKAAVTAPLVVKDGVLTQPEQTELAGGGKAVFEFTIPKDGNYVIKAVVNAASEDANSFFLNLDAQPEDPLMIWDMDVTNGFEERTVSWRGNGDANADEITPKVFKLTAGAHKLILVGREPMKLKSLAIVPFVK